MLVHFYAGAKCQGLYLSGGDPEVMQSKCCESGRVGLGEIRDKENVI